MGKSSDRCDYRTEPKYHKPTRKSPPYSAVPCEGLVMTGNDGTLWIAEHRGISKTPRWFPLDSLKSIPRKKTFRAKKSRKKPTQTSRSKHKRKSQKATPYRKMLRKSRGRAKSRGRSKSRGRRKSYKAESADGNAAKCDELESGSYERLGEVVKIPAMGAKKNTILYTKKNPFVDPDYKLYWCGTGGSIRRKYKIHSIDLQSISDVNDKKTPAVAKITATASVKNPHESSSNTNYIIDLQLCKPSGSKNCSVIYTFKIDLDKMNEWGTNFPILSELIVQAGHHDFEVRNVK